MTVLSCLAVGVAFLIAVALLLLAGIGIGWMLPVKRRRRPPDES
ncbi:MAG TPA: hypothetical protein VOA00_05755 [Thermoanaerobaculia bacterium]|jgi:hypothetical protein|nr:hypothetical protein [Thermoanaerobaculia bacterium]HXM78719.1 hypothetical protein [Thermoanaerobaculia bacterium]